MPVIYETEYEIPSFLGINQSGDGYNLSPRYATDMMNVDVTGGGFAPMRKGTPIAETLGNPIGTLACLSRRFGVAEDEHNVLVAFAGGEVWTKLLDKPDEWVSRYNGLATDHFDFVSYEVNTDDKDTVDVLLFTSATDGMFCLYGDDLHVAPVATPYKFGVLERHNERIWGSGITDKPDTLVYSAPYNPFDWAQNDEIPEDGGGEILQPSWDGDSFVALRTFGNQLLAFKRRGIWKILGTDPGTFTIRQQFGGGAMEENTVAVATAYVMLLGQNGLMRYDGASCEPFQQDALRHLMLERLNRSAVGEACAVMKGKTYMIALPLDGSDTCNAVLEYNITQQHFSLRGDISVKSFLMVDGRVLYTSADLPGQVFELNGKGDVLPLEWVGGYQDLGAKSSVKSAFTVYFIAEAEAPFPLELSIRTEKKKKTKRITVKPGKAHRIHINVQGRYFRLEIRSDSVIPFRINGGMKLDLELDPD